MWRHGARAGRVRWLSRGRTPGASGAGESGGNWLEEHFKDFLRCIKTRQKPRSNEVLGYYVMTALHMGIHSYLSKAVYEFDEKEEKAARV